MATKPTDNKSSPSAPYSQEAEEATIGGVLLDPFYFEQVSGFLRADDFFLLRHTTIWKAFERLKQRNDVIDHITVAEELENMEVLDRIGGRAYLMQCINNLGTAMHTEVYARLIERTAIRRRLMQASDEIKKLALDEALNIDYVIGEAENNLAQATMGADTSRDADPIWEGLSDHYDSLEERLQNQTKQGIPSGFRDIDAVLGGGYPRGEVTIIAARPGMGKTALALCMAVNQARLGLQVLFFSVEMTTQRLLDRMVSAETGIPSRHIRNATLTPQEVARYTEAVGRMSKWRIFIDDTSSLTPEAMRGKSQRTKYQHGLDVIFVDYIQIMSTLRDYGSDQNARVEHISQHLRMLAKDLNVPVIALSQLSRAVEQRKNKRPMLSDLRSSGAIEQDASIVQFLYRDEYYNEASEFPSQGEVITAKNRNDATSTVSLYFEKSLTKFMDASVHRVDLGDLE